MKIQPVSLCFALCLCLTTTAIVTTFTGCAGDRYNRSTGEYVDDTSIESRVRDALGDNPEYKFGGIKVVSFKGTVQLSGFVDTYAQKYTASSIAKKVQGVRDVDNNITVKNTTDRSTGEYIDDKALASRVNTALNENVEYKFPEVAVTALKGTVQLSGLVNTVDQKAKAGDIAKQVPGVQSVVNNISVKDKM